MFSALESISAPVTDAFAVYQTAKIVQLQDRRLGGIYYGLVLVVMTFVVGYEILCCNDQFEKRDVTGTPRINVQHPTVDGCRPGHVGCYSDFHSLAELPYCSFYHGNSTLVAPANRHPCFFADMHTLVPSVVAGATLMVPTRIDQIEERDTISGNNNELMGYFLECDRSKTRGFLTALSRAIFGAEECPGGYVRKPIECILESCRANSDKSLLQQGVSLRNHRSSRGQRHSLSRGTGFMQLNVDPKPSSANLLLASGSSRPGAFAIPDGDVFSIEKLLSLAGISLDNSSTLDDEPVRKAGVVIDIQVIYSNLHALTSTFGQTSVGYDYKVKVRPMHQVKEEVVAWTSSDLNRRLIENRHGLYVVVTVRGTFGFFSIMNLLLMLTTAAAMLTIATVITDKVAIYMLKDRDFYSESKFQTAQLPSEFEGTGQVVTK